LRTHFENSLQELASRTRFENSLRELASRTRFENSLRELALRTRFETLSIYVLLIYALSGLAKGYEQYRESLTQLRPTTEFGEPSSDDLSSEWESSSEAESVSLVVLKDSVASALANNVRRRRANLQPRDSLEGFKDSNLEDEEDKKPTTAPPKRVSQMIPKSP
jgi:hypothetical protein